jgi:hypothetical protein
MTTKPSREGASPFASEEFFRVNPAVLRALPGQARRRAALSPKIDLLVFLAFHAQVARSARSELEIDHAEGCELASVTFVPKFAEVLADLGYSRSSGDFSGSAWSMLNASRDRLSERVRVRFKRKADRKLVDTWYDGPLVAFEPGARPRVRLFGYSPPGDRYYVLVPRRLLALRRELTELGVRLACWLYFKHRGARKDGKLVHRWTMTITPGVLIDAKILRSRKQALASELARMRAGFNNLERLGLLSLAGAAWPFTIDLSTAFFHDHGGK